MTLLSGGILSGNTKQKHDATNVSRAMIKVQPERQGDMDETKQEPSTIPANSRHRRGERQAEAKEIAESLTGKAAAEPKKPSRYSP